jgi:hypothetical protein
VDFSFVFFFSRRGVQFGGESYNNTRVTQIVPSQGCVCNDRIIKGWLV